MYSGLRRRNSDSDWHWVSIWVQYLQMPPDSISEHGRWGVYPWISVVCMIVRPNSLNQRPTLEGLSEVGADLLGKMSLSLSWNLINSISVGWSPVSGIVSQIPLNWCMHWSHSQTITTRTGNEAAFFQYSVSTQLMHASVCTYCTTTQCTLHCADEALKSCICSADAHSSECST